MGINAKMGLHGYLRLTMKEDMLKRITVILLMLFFLSYTGCNFFSGDSLNNGLYINGDIGFSMEFPLDWHKVSRPDFIQSMAFTGVKQRFFVSPSEAEEALMAVSIINAKELPGPFPWDNLWDFIVRGHKSAGLKIQLNTEEEIHGIEVRRLGGTIKWQNDDYYLEAVLFAFENGVVILDIFFREPVNEAMFSELDGIVGGILKID